MLGDACQANVNITATGGGADSNLTATAAAISGNNVTLSADNAVTLQSARSASDYDYKQSSSKYGVGVSYGVGAQNGMTIDLAAGSNQGAGSGNGAACKSRRFAKLLRRLGIKHIRTRPYTPRADGKAERFIQTLLRE